MDVGKRGKIGLFISAYIPLFVILAIKYFSTDLFTIFFITLVVIAAFGSIIFWDRLIKLTYKQTTEDYEILDYKREINYPMSYLLAYIVAIAGFDLNSFYAQLAFIALLILLFIIDSGSEVLFLNPLLYIRGYTFYSIKARRAGVPNSTSGTGHINILLISKENRFQTNQTIGLKELGPVLIGPEKGDGKRRWRRFRAS